MVQDNLNDQEEEHTHVWHIDLANAVHQQISQWAMFQSQSAQYVEDLASQRFSFLLQLLQKALIDFALARLLGDKIPEVANLGLSNAMNAAKSLFEAVGVPGEVVIDHQVRALEVDALTGCIGGDQNFDIL